MSAEYYQTVVIDDAANTDLQTQHQQLLEKYNVVSQQLEDLRLNLGRTLPHELRTPLNSIIGYSQLLLFRGPDRLPDPNQILSMQTCIYNNALRLQHLVENYLLYTQLMQIHAESVRQYQEIWLHKEWLATEGMIRETVWPKAKAVHRQEDVRLTLAKANIWISDRTLRKIIEELVDNAFKFSKPGTPIHIRTHVNQHQWTLTISDQGRGMTAEHMANIGAYMQFDRHRHEQQGSGLGLALARLLAQRNDGELTLDSAPNQGTTVTVVFNRE